jgi:hypothetical protein
MGVPPGSTGFHLFERSAGLRARCVDRPGNGPRSRQERESAMPLSSPHISFGRFSSCEKRGFGSYFFANSASATLQICSIVQLDKVSVIPPNLQAWLAARTEWLVTYKDKIGSAASIFGLLIGLGGFWLTIAQLGRTAEALRATNSYQIQKDARELAEKIRADNVFRRALETGPPSDPRDQITFSDDIWKLSNFYLSVYRQSSAHGISEDFYKSFGQDFCGLFGNKYFSDEWNKMLSEKKLNEAERNMKAEWCGNV